MKKNINNKLNSKDIKPTAMRQLVLNVLTEKKRLSAYLNWNKNLKKQIRQLYIEH